MSRLNLGSNSVHYQYFENVDIREAPGVTIVDDVSKLEKIPDGSSEAIIAHAILEHFSPDRTDDVLKVWYRKMQDGATIEIGVPDGELIYERYREDKDWAKLVHSLFGNIQILRDWHGEDAEKYGHHMLFSKDFLRKKMESVGFKDIVEVPKVHPDCFSLKGIK